MTPSVHPFPARMAPEIALANLKDLRPGSTVLDPMTGSGTVARQAVSLGHSALGFDLDPLAVLISKVSTTKVADDTIASACQRLLHEAAKLEPCSIALPWIDDSIPASEFVRYWFGGSQISSLRQISYLLSEPERLEISTDAADVLRVALSRIIVTKRQCASLAQDTSHSRPHRVSIESDYDVYKGFAQSVLAVRRRLAAMNGIGSAQIGSGDARDLKVVGDGTVDAVLTSPPYLNAIDYLRGHRLSLVWLGHKLEDLSAARSASIGSERRPDEPIDQNFYADMKGAMGEINDLPRRYVGMIERYIADIYRMLAEVIRVMKAGTQATFVMGNSCLRGVFIHNSEALSVAATKVGLTLLSRIERELPPQHRYLPTPSVGALGKRMRSEVILTFAKP
ncbi:MAG: hypothetical protein JWR10_2279 [Rubritepida sp.]|nr:hypothetical protein [Rubritepida sp.]